MKRLSSGALLLAVAASPMFACSDASHANAFGFKEKLADGTVIDSAYITWRGPGARLCVTAPEATCPADKDGTVTGGATYWVIDATCFNAGNGFESPVAYGVVPKCAKDVTDLMGGPKGGARLEVGPHYKVTIAGFGGAPAEQDLVLH